MSAHTTGPWKFDPGLGCKAIKGGKCGAHKQAQYVDIAYTTGLSDDAKDTANARLIAAAPELLAALEIALKSVRSDDVSNAPMPEAYARLALGWIRAKFEDKAAAAIAKAKGESA